MGFSFLFFFFFNNRALFFYAIWSHCGAPVNFRALELLSGPPLVGVHPFVLFSAACRLLPLGGVAGAGPLPEGSERSPSAGVNALPTQHTQAGNTGLICIV